MNANWIIFVIGLGVGAVPAWVFQGARLDASVAKYDLFVEQVKSVGELAEAEATRIEDEHKQLKKDTDNENKLALDTLRADIKRMRNDRSGGSFVPAAPAGSSRPDLACYDRTKLIGATGRLIDGVRGLVDEGSAATINLNTAKAWARGINAK